jgi:hypothetical protein
VMMLMMLFVMVHNRLSLATGSERARCSFSDNSRRIDEMRLHSPRPAGFRS